MRALFFSFLSIFSCKKRYNNLENPLKNDTPQSSKNNIIITTILNTKLDINSKISSIRIQNISNSKIKISSINPSDTTHFKTDDTSICVKEFNPDEFCDINVTFLNTIEDSSYDYFLSISSPNFPSPIITKIITGTNSPFVSCPNPDDLLNFAKAYPNSNAKIFTDSYNLQWNIEGTPDTAINFRSASFDKYILCLYNSNGLDLRLTLMDKKAQKPENGSNNWYVNSYNQLVCEKPNASSCEFKLSN